MEQIVLIVLAAVLILSRLPSFFARQNVPRNKRLLVTIIVYALLVMAIFAVNGFGYLLSLFR